MTKTTFTALTLAGLVALASGYAQAGTIYIDNQKDSEIAVKVTGEGDALATKEIPVPAKAMKYKMEVTPNDIKGKTIFSLKGKTTAFTGDACDNLSTDSDYTVTFTNDTVGTKCVAVPVTVK